MANAGSPRILITRLSHIGDCVLTLPMLCAVRKRHPRAFIAWAVEKPADQLLRGHPGLDQVIVVPRGWMKSIRTIVQMGAILRSLHFDVVLDPQSLTKSSALAWLSGATTRIGFAKPIGRELAPWLNNRRIATSWTHLVDKSLDVARAYGCQAGDAEFELLIDPHAASSLQRSWTDPPSSAWIAINPGGTWKSKRWELDRYAEVARRTRQELGVASVVTWAGDEERTMAEQIVQMSNGAARCAPATNLRELAALFSQAQAYVGGDTGPMHIAAAVGTPCIALFGPTRPCDCGPYGRQHIAIQAWYQAGSCRQRRNADNLAMRDVSVEQVCAAIESVVRPDIARWSTGAA